MSIIEIDLTNTRTDRAGNWRSVRIACRQAAAEKSSTVDFSANGIEPARSGATGPALAIDDDFLPEDVIVEAVAAHLGINLRGQRITLSEKRGRRFRFRVSRKKVTFFG